MTRPRTDAVLTPVEAPNAVRRRAGLRVMSVVNLRPRKLGSFEEYTIALSRRLVGEGGESVLVFSEAPPSVLASPYLEAGAILEHKPYRSFDRESATPLLQLIRQHKPDVVHFHFVNLLSLDVAMAALFGGTRIVFSEHSSNPVARKRPLKRMALFAAKKLFAAAVDRVVAPSNYVNARLVGEGLPTGKIRTIWNGVNVDRFRRPVSVADVRAKYGLDPSAMLVASSALLIPEKGIGFLIEAAREVVRTSPDVQFVHIGDGPRLQEYRDRVASLGLENHFKFAGLLNLAEIAPLVSSADVFTLPCVWGEAFSLVVLEAMAAGKPVIATRIGGNMEAVEDGRSGILVPPGDPAALAAAILRLQNDPALRQQMAEESGRRSTEFHVDRWVDQTIDLYHELLRG